MRVARAVFGVTRDGSPIELFSLENGNGMAVRAMTLGATLTAVEVPDRGGDRDNVTLYLETAEEYVQGHPCLGSVCGRYANRIAGGRFVLDGVEYR
ncbi:MAG: galactose-1-epimerase, partial [Thermogutta sp.]|nr:galactose-1-epimerase [Thermogutta sp.]